MPKSYSKDLGKKVIEETQGGNFSKRKIEKRFRISSSFIYQLWSRYEATGSYNAKPPKVDKVGGEHIKVWLENEPDLTLNDLCDKYAEHFSIVMGKSTIDRALKRMNISYKKGCGCRMM